MLLKNRLCEPENVVRAGMFCLAVGLVAQRYVHPPGAFWQGFVSGVSGLLIGMSIALNLRYLVLRRARKNSDEGTPCA